MLAWLWMLLALAGGPATGSAARLELDAIVRWRADDPAFGGFSAFEVLDGGARFVAVSDKGAWAMGGMAREEGRLTRATLAGIGPLHGISGEPLGGRETDAEGMAVDARGRIYLSFEGFHRVRRYDRIDGAATDVPSHRAFRRMQDNSGFEALAIDAAGILHAIPERSGAWDRPFPVYRFRHGRWDHALRLPREGKFLVVGADFGPDGQLYVLEREFSWLGGFATRLRRFAVGPEGINGGTTLLQTRLGELDNMEGISVWQDDRGRTRVTLISDDNFLALQRTLLAEYILIDD